MNEQHGSPVYGVTKFFDLSETEFRNKYLMETPILKAKNDPSKGTYRLKSSYPDPPDNFDWRNHQAVTAVKDQGNKCKSSWSFAPVEAVESQWFLQGRLLMDLSVQQPIDCNNANGTNDCTGGSSITTYEYLIKSKGIEKQSDYPYTATKGVCNFKLSKVVAQIHDWIYVTKNQSEYVMEVVLVSAGPLAIAVDSKTWQFYYGGIVQHWCGESLDHYALITGYEAKYNWFDERTDIWNIRNSWGENWGEEGYIWIERNKNLCGVADQVTMPLV